MLSALKKILRIRTTSCTESPLFSGSAYFSRRVPGAVSEKWVAHGGEISSGTTLDVRARYFFAIDPSEPWVTKLFSKSVLVIHAGWIVHCVDEDFRVPIAQYILDDRFIPEPPYKLTGNPVLPIYVPLSEPEEPTYIEPAEPAPTPLQTSDTPSTPTSMPRKRKREQAYFDSPSGSLVFSGFDKDGIPLRPRKLRKLRFDPSFSPEGARSGQVAVQRLGPDSDQDDHDVSGDVTGFCREHGQDRPNTLRGYRTTVRSPDTPDKPLGHGGPSATTFRHLSVDGHPPNSIHVSSQANSVTQEKMGPVRTIDFTNLPPPTRRRRFLEAYDTKSSDTSTSTILSVVKSADHKVKTPKKISFADHARVCVYTISPRRLDGKDGVDIDPDPQSLGEDGHEVDGKTREPRDEGKGSVDSTAEATRPDSDPKLGDDSTRLLNENQSTNDTFTLTIDEVQAMRRRLLESTAENGVENGQLAALFELGKICWGMEFRHVW